VGIAAANLMSPVGAPSAAATGVLIVPAPAAVAGSGA